MTPTTPPTTPPVSGTPASVAPAVPGTAVPPAPASTPPATGPRPDLSAYRQFLVVAEQKSQEDFDKTVLSLSGGALGISFVFLKDVIGSSPVASPGYLLSAWICWALSSLAVLGSFYLSHLALRGAIRQVDAGTIYRQRAGGSLSLALAWLNAAGAIFFFVGVCLITTFAAFNLSNGAHHVREASNGTAAPTVAPASPTALKTTFPLRSLGAFAVRCAVYTGSGKASVHETIGANACVQ